MKIIDKNQWYISVHTWLRALYGDANKCENKKCNHKSKVFNWALIKGKEYDFKRSNFKMLCRSCHTKYDMTDEWKEKISFMRKGIKHSEETKRKISESHNGKINTRKTRLKISKSNKGQKRSIETKRKMSKNHIGMKGKHHTKKSKLKMINSQKLRREIERVNNVKH